MVVIYFFDIILCCSTIMNTSSCKLVFLQYFIQRDYDVVLFESSLSPFKQKVEKMQSNSTSKYTPSKSAFAGKTPFEKRMRRVLGEESPQEKKTTSKTTTSICNRTRILLIVLVVFIAVLFSSSSSSQFETESSIKSELRTKNVVLCGASSGIGEEIAYFLSSNNVKNLVISARRTEKLKQVMEKCLRLGAQNVHIISADFSKLDSASTFTTNVAKVIDVVDVLLLNHAWIHARDWYEHIKDDNSHMYVRKMMETNFISYANVVSSLLSSIMSPTGRVLVSSSGAGKGPVHKMAAYSASKHAIHGFFGSLRQDLIWHKSNVSITEAVYVQFLSKS